MASTAGADLSMWSNPGQQRTSSNSSGPSVPTYRHLLSNSTLNPSNPLRVIALCDVDAAYAQFEMSRLKIPKDKPVAVQQWQGLIAVNYPARKFGISRHETVTEAKKKCPDLIAIHVATYKDGEEEAGYWPDAVHETHKVSLEPYRRESVKILKIFSRGCPTIEKASIDEAYLDFTQPVRETLIQRYPHLAAPPPDAPLGMDTPLPAAPTPEYEGLGHVLPLKAPPVRDGTAGEQEGLEGQEEEDTMAGITSSPLASQEAASWSDIAVSIGAELMLKCRNAVKEELGYTTSAGIAPNKTLAKLCAGLNKPDAQTVLRPGAITAFLQPLEFQKIRFLGGKLGSQIAEDFGANLVGELWRVPLEEMQRKYGGEAGLWAWEILRGIDRGEVTQKQEVKSMISSKNFKPPIGSWEEASHWLRIISTELTSRLTEARQINPGVWPKTISLSFRSETYVSRSRQAAFPFTSSLSSESILRHAERLLKEFMEEKDRAGASFGRCTNLSVQFQGLERLERGQKGIEAFMGADRRRGSSSSSHKVAEGPSKAKKAQTTAAGSSKSKSKSESASATKRTPTSIQRRVSFTCERCGQVIAGAATATAAAGAASGDGGGVGDSDKEALERLKQVHADEHFAKELLQSSRVVVGSSTNTNNNKTTTNSSSGRHPRRTSETHETASSSSKQKRPSPAAAAPGTISAFFSRSDDSSSSKKKKKKKKT